jgi:alkylation response protein AidB-like acyl-CoA dehydrogenase
MATVIALPTTKIRGGSFLIDDRTPDEVFTPEDFTEQHLLIAQTAEEFATKEIVPNIEKMEHKDFGVIRELVRKAGELGLSGVDVAEQYGGMELPHPGQAVA